MTNEVALKSKLLEELELFEGLNFAELNSSIETLAAYAGELTDKEKELGTTILTTWESDVLERLDIRKQEMKTLRSFLTSTDRGTDRSRRSDQELLLDDVQLEKLAELTDTKNAYSSYVEAYKHYRGLRNNKPIADVSSIEESISSSLELDSLNRVNTFKHTMKVNRAESKMLHAYTDWKLSMLDHPLIQETLKNTNAYYKNIEKLARQCKDKAARAKINISISNIDVRKSLQELIKFTEAI